MSIINIDESKCVGCNSCIRVCPSADANAVFMDDDGRIIVRINDEKCIKCGACVKECNHGARYFIDDTEEFMKDVEAGRTTAIIVAPAIKIAFASDWKDLLAYFRKKGVRFITDVSFGADICTWAHLKLVEQNPSAKFISQPCAAIVNYILKHNHSLIKFLSPGQSPMMCTAIYLRKCMGFSGKIAALSPCIAKKDEFSQNDYVINYNVTLEKLAEYLRSHNINYKGLAGNSDFVFDGPKGYVGAFYPVPGGLKENLKLHAPGLNVINSEGTSKIYHELEEYVKAEDRYRPAVFDVLNCETGCNGGPGLGIKYDTFKMSALGLQTMQITDAERRNGFDRKGNDTQFINFDRELKLSDFLRKYKAEEVKKEEVSEKDIQRVLTDMHKITETDKNFNCHACGHKSCREMAIAVAKGCNIMDNCRQYNRYVMLEEKESLTSINEELAGTAFELEEIITQLEASVRQVGSGIETIRSCGIESCEDMGSIAEYMTGLNGMNSGILEMMSTIAGHIETYSVMTDSVKAISGKINLLSLNASIESARAGEAGRAFAVVAQNIRELSESSKKSVENAEDNENAIKASIQEVNKTVNDFSDNFNNLVEKLEAARSKVNSVSDNSNPIIQSMNRVTAITERLDSITKRAQKILKQ